jgi:YHS domain-containing protein
MGLIRIFMFALVALAAYLLFKRVLERPGRPTRGDSAHDERLGRLVQDPHCGIYVDSKEAVRRKVPDGELFFCSKTCAEAYFEKARHGA